MKCSGGLQPRFNDSQPMQSEDHLMFSALRYQELPGPTHPSVERPPGSLLTAFESKCMLDVHGFLDNYSGPYCIAFAVLFWY